MVELTCQRADVNTFNIYLLIKIEKYSPVGKQLVGDKATGNLSYNVTPKERSVDQTHSLWIPVKLSFLERKEG